MLKRNLTLYIINAGGLLITILLFTLVAVEIVFGICHESCLYLAHTLLQNVAVWNNYNTILIMTVLT